MAVVDVFDALISKRPYKAAMSHEKAFAIINEGSRTHFDPEIVDAFNNAQSDLLRSAAMWTDL